MQEGKYNKQINHAIDYITANVTQPLTLDSIAALANMSPYYFHRVFTKFTGETLAKYIQRKRLELAANILRGNNNIPVSNIAYETGFNSTNVFCRNFKKHFGITALEYRNIDKNAHDNISTTVSKNSTLISKDTPYQRKYSHYFCTSKSIIIGDKIMNCNFEIKTLPAMHIIYCRHYGAYDKMEEAFSKLLCWAYPRGLVSGPAGRLVSVYHDHPDITKIDKLTSDACLIVDNHVKTDGEIGSYDLNGGLYAVGRFEISMEEFGAAWRSMFKLINEHGCQCTEGHHFEIYQNNRDEHPDKKWIIDICIPVATI